MASDSSSSTRPDATMNLRALLEALPDQASDSSAISTLSDIRAALAFVQPSALSTLVPGLSFSRLFDYLRTSDSAQISVCCEVLDRLLMAVDSRVLLPSFYSDLLLGITHGSTDVKALCLKQIIRATDIAPQHLGNYVDIVIAVIQLLADDSLETAQKASHICVLLGRSVDGLDLLLKNGRVYQQLSAVVEKDDVVRYRVYEMIVNVSIQSVEALQQSADCGLLHQLVDELNKTDDILVRLNCLELLAILASCSHGLAYLDERGALTKLEHILRGVESDPFAALLLPGIIKFFGNVCQLQPKEMLSRFRPFLHILFSIIDSDDVSSLTGIAVETFAFVGKSADGKLALEKLGDVMHSCCCRIGRLIVNAPSDIRVKTLDALRQLLYLPVADQTSELLGLTENWFNALAPSPTAKTTSNDPVLSTILTIARQPFSEFRLAALGVISSLALLPWAQLRLHVYPGFEEYLLDRATEVTKEGLEEKYCVIRRLVESPTVADVFGWSYVARLRAYVAEGAFYVRRVTQVAVDDGD